MGIGGSRGCDGVSRLRGRGCRQCRRRRRGVRPMRVLGGWNQRVCTLCAVVCGTDFAGDPALVAADVEHGLVDEKGGRQEGQTRVSIKGSFGVVPVPVGERCH